MKLTYITHFKECILCLQDWYIQIRMAVPILRISAVIKDNHQGFKGVLVFGLFLTSMKVILCGGWRSGSICVRVHLLCGF